MEVTVPLLAACPDHGYVPSPYEVFFDLKDPIDTSKAGYLVAQNLSSHCPYCGKKTFVEDGFYNFAEIARKLLIELNPDRRQAAEIASIADSASRHEISMEQAASKAEAIVPGGSKLFNIREWGDQAKATFFSAIVGAFALGISQCSFEGPLVQVEFSSSPTYVEEGAGKNGANKDGLNSTAPGIAKSAKPKKRPLWKSKRPMWRP